MLPTSGQTGQPWRQAEIDVLVAAYVDMLRRELRGERVIKAERIRALRENHVGTDSRLVERKMQKVSAVLDERGYAFIDGYKPASALST